MQLKIVFSAIFWILITGMLHTEPHQLGEHERYHRHSAQARDKYRKLIMDYIEENFILDNGIFGNQSVDAGTSRVLNFLINEEGHYELLLSNDGISIKRLKKLYKKLKRDNYILKLGQLIVCKKIDELMYENFPSIPGVELYRQVIQFSASLESDQQTTKKFLQLIVTCMDKFKIISLSE